MGVTLIINGCKVTVPDGTSVLDAATQAGFSVPTFCHDPELTKPGACRICVVEIKGMRNLPASCVTVASEGMEVETESPAVVEARKTIIDLLLANHPKDCLTCEKSGDCRLQEYAYRYGVLESTFQGDQSQHALDESNPYILRDPNKCILCGKCVRSCGEIPERSVIDFMYRGFNTKVGPAMDTDLKESNCVYCFRCVAICPVGALTVKTMAGKGRQWELEKQETTCTFCDYGCAFDLNYKDGQVIGVTAKAPGKGRPLCNKGYLGINFLHVPTQVALPLVKKDGEFVETSWEDALGISGITAKLAKIKEE